MNPNSTTQLNSPGWLFFVKASFVAAVAALGVGITFMPTDLWVKGYMGMGVLFAIGTTFTLSKTIRDEFESSKLINRLHEAKAEKMLKEYDTEPDAL